MSVLICMFATVSCGDTGSSSVLADGRGAADTAGESGVIGNQSRAYSRLSALREDICYASRRRVECGVEVPATYVSEISYLPCRLPAFGLEGYQLVGDEEDIEYLVRLPDTNACDYMHFDGNHRWHGPTLYPGLLQPGFLRGVDKLCTDHHLPGVRAAWGDAAFVTCTGARYDKCKFGGVNSFVTYRLRLRTYAPVFRQEFNHPACPAAGPPSTRLVAEPIYFACRHPLNGIDPNGCGSEVTK